MIRILGFLFVLLGFSGIAVHFVAEKIEKQQKPVLEQQVAVEEAEPEDSGIYFFPIAPSSTIRVGFSSSSPQHVSTWATGTTDIAINGGYFHDDYMPSGYFMMNGTRIGNRQFDEDKTGLLTITSNTIRIHDLNHTPLAQISHIENAIQSYPLLIKDGQAGVEEDSGKKARRTAIGLTETDEAYIIVARTNISLYEFGVLLASSTVPFKTVLNLDGGPSTGFAYRSPTTSLLYDSITPVPQAILIDSWQ